jgi:hypothetical protein
MSCEHQWANVLAGTPEEPTPSPLEVCMNCGASKVGDRIVAPGLKVEEMPPEEPSEAVEETSTEEATEGAGEEEAGTEEVN